MTMPRLFEASSSVRRRAMSGRNEAAKTTMEPGKVVIACIIRSKSVHWAMIRRSSSIARTFAVPARKIACESARITLFMFCASTPVKQTQMGRDRLSFSHGPGAAFYLGQDSFCLLQLSADPKKLSGIAQMRVVEIIHMPFVTPLAQRYL